MDRTVDRPITFNLRHFWGRYARAPEHSSKVDLDMARFFIRGIERYKEARTPLRVEELDLAAHVKRGASEVGPVIDPGFPVA